MSDSAGVASFTLRGVKVMECSLEGKRLRSEKDAIDLITEAVEQRAGLILIPVNRLDPDFFRLNSRVAGEFLQKFVTYGLRLAIIGDISHHLAESGSLRDFVYESNRGPHVWFLADRGALDTHLT
jgi:hypothetical protein